MWGYIMRSYNHFSLYAVVRVIFKLNFYRAAVNGFRTNNTHLSNIFVGKDKYNRYTKMLNLSNLQKKDNGVDTTVSQLIDINYMRLLEQN